MKNKVIVTPFFESKYKRLAKKFPNLPHELINLEKELIVNPKLGEPIGGGFIQGKICKL